MKIIITSFFALLFSLSMFSQNDIYAQQWREITKFELDVLPKSALAIITKIEARAIAENNPVQLIKTLLFKSKFALILEEDAQLKVINDFKAQIAKSEAPIKNVLENMLAKVYWDYFSANRYTFYNRTKTDEKVDELDFRTWDLETLFAQIAKHYSSSLENEALLKSTTTTAFEPILTTFKDSNKLRPTLYDFLAHNALDFYKTSENSITKPVNAFPISDAAYGEDVASFQGVKITSNKEASLALNALSVFKNLAAFHLENNTDIPLAAIDVERLNYVSANGDYTDKAAIFLQALKDGKKLVNDPYAKAIYDFEIAQHIHNEGYNYTGGEDETNRWAFKEALQICEQITKNVPETYIAIRAQNLLQGITNPSVSLQFEGYLPIGSDSRMLVSYANVKDVNISVYKITAAEMATLRDIYKPESKRAFFKKLPLEKQWIQNLKDEGDFRNHSTEILLTGLPQGQYIIVAKPTNEEDKLFYENQGIQYTNMALTTSQENDHHIFQLVDRNNGKPITNATCTVTNNRRNKRRKKYTTNSKGFFKIAKSNNDYRNISILARHNTDEANFKNLYRYNNYYKEKPRRYKAFLFTDRSIYRPKQIVYFKGIVTQRIEERSAVLPKQNVLVNLYDANGEEIASQDLETNEYGTVAGSFILPSGVLTGQFRIELKTKDSKSISANNDLRVEEYKRPKFETSFKPVKESYRVNDEITITGQATSFSGSTITNAKVVYKVTRQVRYPNWYYWGRSSENYSEGQEITFGETTTNDKGEYNINFKAIPDAKVDKKGQPVFQYEISTDVTDINGETQSAKTVVNIGYHSLTINLNVAKKLNKQNKKQRLKFKTVNLNGQTVAAAVNIAIYKLKAPSRVLIKRKWDAPDYQEFSETEFKTRFPHIPYTNENEIFNWEQGEEVFNKTVNTASTKEINFGNLKKWKSGAYVIIATTKDTFNQEVLTKRYTTLFDAKDKTPEDNQLFSINFDKETYNAGDNVWVKLKANATLNVTVSIEKNNELIETYIVALDNNTKDISVPVTANDVGGFTVHYSATVFNSFIGGSKFIQVPAPKTDLTIETKTFRDKLAPGVPETWRFKIKGADGEKVSAELLASMYDVSLDQFAPHQWGFNPQPVKRYRSLGSPSSNQSFVIRSFYLQYPNTTTNKSVQLFNRFNWFGFNIANSNYNNAYINNIGSNIEQKYSSDIKDGILQGYIYDDQGLPLPGVNVIVPNTERGTTTDFDGRFEIAVAENERLIFTYIGYDPRSYIVNKNNLITVYLSDNNASLNEVVITGYGSTTKERRSLGYAVTTVESESISAAPEDDVARALNGKVAGVEISSGLMDRDAMEVEELLNTLPGVNNNQEIADFSKVKIRTNLQETAFFFPQLKTDKAGDISFSFTTPEALTRWKLQLLAHTKELNSKVTSLETVTQKELMVVPNAPRFLREGDEITISSKISNLSDTPLTGQAVLQLTDAITRESIDIALDNSDNVKNFSVSEKNNTQVSWQLKIPFNVQAVEYKVIAKTATFSDGEQNIVPVLSNRMLVTETLPMWVRSNETKTFSLDKLASNTSTTLKHHKLTLEVTSNPAWYAVQALPYLMEYPYECNEQTFSRYYANSLASHIANSNPRIKAVFDQWANSDALLSNLEKNEELKSLLIQETPWLRDAQSETEQKKRIALLFDLNVMQHSLSDAAAKLRQNQMNNGAWPWFNGGNESRYITQHIASGFGHLKKLGVSTEAYQTDKMIRNAVKFLDAEFVEEYNRMLKYTAKEALNKDHLSPMQTQYLYMRSFFPEIKESEKVAAIRTYYLEQMETYWTSRTLYTKGMIALVLHRNGKNATAIKITKALEENSITSEKLGMYWKSNTPSWYWYQAPVETQALMIEVFSEIEKDIEIIDNLKIWLLKSKQTNQWSTTKSTSEAVYALLLQGTDWLSVREAVEVKVGNNTIDPSKMDDVKVEAGTGYFKTSWNGAEVKEDMATVTIRKKDEGIAWGGLYWQYFEDLDKITSAETPLKLKKKLFLKSNTNTGEELSEITEATTLNVGHLVRVRIELRVDREMDFVHMKDMRAAGLEPIDVISRYKWQDGLGYYQATKDASTNFFFDTLNKGIYVFEYDLRVNNAGTFSNGITTIQSMYAPEFSSHSEGLRIKVAE